MMMILTGRDGRRRVWGGGSPLGEGEVKGSAWRSGAGVTGHAHPVGGVGRLGEGVSHTVGCCLPSVQSVSIFCVES